MPDPVKIKIETDLADVEGDAKRLSSALDGAAKGGIAGFEKAQQSVVDLTKRLAELRADLLKTSDPKIQEKLNQAIQDTASRLKTARTEMRAMGLESREATEKAQLLAASLGVRLPAGLDQLIARLPIVQAGLEKAFAATIIFAFTRAISEAVTNWEKFQESIGKALGPISELQVKVANLFGLLKDYSIEARNASEASKALAEAEQALSVRVLQAQLDFNAAGKTGIEQMVAQSNNRVTMLKREQANAEQAFRSQYDLLILREKESLAAQVQSQVFRDNAEAAKKAAQEAKSLALHEKQLTEETQRAALAFQNQRQFIIAPDVEATALARMNTDVASAQAALKDLPPLINEIYTANEIWSDSAIQAGKDQIEAAKKAQDAIEKTAQGIEGFIDRVFLQARSLADVWHQFLMQMLGSFVKWVSREIATALLGMRQLSGSGAGGSGLGGIMGGILGIGGMAAPAFAGGGGGGATGIEAAFTGPLSMGAITSLGGQAGTGSGIPAAQGGATWLSGLMEQWNTMGPLAKMGVGAGLIGGTALVGQGFGQGSILKGALGGAALGATSALMAGMLFTPYGAIAAGVYAAIGGLIGWIGRGRAKRKAAEAEQQYEFAANDLYDQYKQWKLDYDTALVGMRQLIEQGQYDLTHRGLGGPGRNAADNLTRVIQDEIRALDELRKQRELSTAAMAGMPLPEFSIGGYVGRGGILAVLHPGEFVMQKSAVDALGTNFLTALNRAPRFDTGGAVSSDRGLAGRSFVIQHMTMAVYPERGMSDAQAADMVVRGWRKARLDGAI